MNPYEPPETEFEKRIKEPKEKVQFTFFDFGVIVFVVVIGTPILYDTIHELVERYL